MDSASAIHRELGSIDMRREAAAPESRNSARYQWESPICSDRARKFSSPMSGSAPSASHEMSTGSRCRWIVARLLVPFVSAPMWDRAAAGAA